VQQSILEKNECGELSGEFKSSVKEMLATACMVEGGNTYRHKYLFLLCNLKDWNVFLTKALCFRESLFLQRTYFVKHTLLFRFAISGRTVFLDLFQTCTNTRWWDFITVCHNLRFISPYFWWGFNTLVCIFGTPYLKDHTFSFIIIIIFRLTSEKKDILIKNGQLC